MTIVSGEKPRLTKGYRNRIRAFKFLLENGRVIESDKSKILGHLAYAAMIDKYRLI
jgi:hypothetical protein